MGSAATWSGTQLTLTVNVTFAPAFAGVKHFYSYLRDGSGAQTQQPWLDGGAWNIVTTPPLSASCAATPAQIQTGEWTTFVARPMGGTPPYRYSWSGTVTGAYETAAKYFPLAGVYTAQVNVSDSSNPAQSFRSQPCAVPVSAPNSTPLSVSCGVSPSAPQTGQNVTFLANVSGGTAPYTYTWTGAVSGSMSAQTVNFNTGGTYAAQLSVSDSSSSVRVGAASCSVAVSTAPQDQPPTADPVTITQNAADPLQATVVVPFTDPRGSAALNLLELRFAPSNDLSLTANSCYLRLNRADGSYYLLNDAGTAWDGPGGTRSNSICTISSVVANAPASGSQVSYTAVVRFAAPGTWYLYSRAQDVNGTTSGWQPHRLFTPGFDISGTSPANGPKMRAAAGVNTSGRPFVLNNGKAEPYPYTANFETCYITSCSAGDSSVTVIKTNAHFCGTYGVELQYFASTGAQTGLRNVSCTVVMPDLWTGRTTTSTAPVENGIYVYDATPTINSVTPSAIDAGSTPVSVVISGTGFGSNSSRSASQIEITPNDGLTWTVSSWTSTRITLSITAGQSASAGARQLKVTSQGANGAGFVAGGDSSSVSLPKTLQINAYRPVDQTPVVSGMYRYGTTDNVFTQGEGVVPASIKGQYFGANPARSCSQITFSDGVTCNTITGWSDTDISLYVNVSPAAPEGTGTVTVISAGVSGNQFNFAQGAPPTANRGSGGFNVVGPPQLPIKIFLIHGLSETAQDMKPLADNLRSFGGFDSQRIIDADFTFPGAGSIQNGSTELAFYILARVSSGQRIAFVTHSMGSLIVRHMLNEGMLNTISYIGSPFTPPRVVGLATLGGPHLGYPWLSIDGAAPNKNVIQVAQMGSYLLNGDSLDATSTMPDALINQFPDGPLSSFLKLLRKNWNVATVGSKFFAAAGRACSTLTRSVLYAVEENGCPASDVYSDGVVCAASAAGTYPSSKLGVTVPFTDPARLFQHSENIGLIGFNVLCPNQPGKQSIVNPNTDTNLFIMLKDFLNALY